MLTESRGNFFVVSLFYGWYCRSVCNVYDVCELNRSNIWFGSLMISRLVDPGTKGTFHLSSRPFSLYLSLPHYIIADVINVLFSFYALTWYYISWILINILVCRCGVAGGLGPPDHQPAAGRPHWQLEGGQEAQALNLLAQLQYCTLPHLSTCDDFGGYKCRTMVLLVLCVDFETSLWERDRQTCMLLSCCR